MFDAVPPDDPIALQQSPGFARALEALGTPPLRLEDGTVVLRRRFGPLPVSMLTRPSVNDTAAIRSHAQNIPARGPVLIAPERPLPLDQIGALPLISPMTVATLDLTPDADILRAGLHQKWRNRLHHAERQGLRITRQNMPDDPGHWLLQSDLLQQRARGYRSWPIPLTLAYGHANPGHSKLFTAFLGKDPVAAILVLIHGQSATYHIGHTQPSGRAVSAHTLLMWSAIIWARSKGIRLFELGTVDTEDGRGLARFKLGTGAQAHVLGGTWLWWPPLTQAFRPLARLDRALMRLG